MSDRHAPPARLAMEACTLASLASRFDLELIGPDRTVDAFNYVHAPEGLASRQLTYAASAGWVEECTVRRIAGCVTTRALVGKGEHTSFLVTEGDPVEAFFTMFATLQREGRWKRLDAHRAVDAEIASTAVIRENVVIGPRCRIMDHAVVMPNSWLGEDVVLKPGAVIGGDGFEIKRMNGRRQGVPHAGGVWLADGVGIGSGTCVDRGLFGEFTTVGAGTQVDNLVHIAHRAVLGRDCSVIACAEVSGSVVLGDGVWVGPNASINQRLTLGEHAFIGTGAVVTKPVPAFALAYGSPARVKGWRCRCGASLEFAAAVATCSACGAAYSLAGDQVTPIPG